MGIGFLECRQMEGGPWEGRFWSTSPGRRGRAGRQAQPWTTSPVRALHLENSAAEKIIAVIFKIFLELKKKSRRIVIFVLIILGCILHPKKK